MSRIDIPKHIYSAFGGIRFEKSILMRKTQNYSILRGGVATTAFSFAVVVVSLIALVFFLDGTRENIIVDALTINHVSSKTKRPTTYLIDGNNFLGQRGVHGLPRDGDKLAEFLMLYAQVLQLTCVKMFAA